MQRIEAKLDALAGLLTERTARIMGQLDDLITAIDAETNAVAAETNAVAAEVEALKAALAAAPTVTQTQLDKLAAISARLQGIAADPANPVPAPAPATNS